jgi:acyl carrier protein
MNDTGTNNTGSNSTGTNNIAQHLNALLVDKFDVPAQAVREDATLGDLDLDSLARVELFITLEEHWGVAFDEDGGDDAAAAITVAQLVSRIRTLASDRLAAAEQRASESSAPGMST